MIIVKTTDVDGKDLTGGRYAIEITRVAKDLEGNSIEVIDHTELTTLYELNTLKDQQLKQLEVINKNLAQLEERIKAIMDYRKVDITAKIQARKQLSQVSQATELPVNEVTK